MKFFDHSLTTKISHASESMLHEQSPTNEAPPMDVISRETVVRKAAAGQRSAAWQLLHWIKENDAHALAAVDALDDDRLAQYLLEWIALGTWAGKPFVVPVSLRSPAARMHLSYRFPAQERSRQSEDRTCPSCGSPRRSLSSPSDCRRHPGHLEKCTSGSGTD